MCEVQNVSMAGIGFNLILIRIGHEHTNTRNIEGYSQNAYQHSALLFRSPTVVSSQAQTCDTGWPEEEDRVESKMLNPGRIDWVWIVARTESGSNNQLKGRTLFI